MGCCVEREAPPGWDAQDRPWTVPGKPALPGSLQFFYDVDRVKLGQGTFGSVSKCRSKDTGNVHACKTIPKTANFSLGESLQQEIGLMQMMDHPNILKLLGHYEDKQNVYLVLELCTGGELFDRIIELQHFTEVQAAIVMQEILHAVQYMHSRHVVHRDLKPENFLFTTKEPLEKCTLKIIDFGLSRTFSRGELLKTRAGTPFYIAPEILAGGYNELCDVWSCGVIMYVVLVGYPPFQGENDTQVLASVKQGKFYWDKADWANISEDALHLVQRTLCFRSVERISAHDALEHVWVKHKAPQAAAVPLHASMVQNLRSFRSQNRFKKAARGLIASQMSENQIKALRETFMALDADGDGHLTIDEMKVGLQNAGFQEIPPELQRIMDDTIQNWGGSIDYSEFLTATLDQKIFQQEDLCWAAFRTFDINGDGSISKEELAQVLKENEEVAKAFNGDDSDLAQIMLDIDTNGDGMIDFAEFMKMMRDADEVAMVRKQSVVIGE